MRQAAVTCPSHAIAPTALEPGQEPGDGDVVVGFLATAIRLAAQGQHPVADEPGVAEFTGQLCLLGRGRVAPVTVGLHLQRHDDPIYHSASPTGRNGLATGPCTSCAAILPNGSWQGGRRHA